MRIWLRRAVLLLLAVVTVGYLALLRPDLPYDELERRYANAASRWQDLPNGIRMHYRDQGSPNGRVLLLVHGYSASLHTWEPWVARLGDRYRLVTIDLPGHGLTRTGTDYMATIGQYVADVDAFLSARNLDRVTIVGSSMGGAVAWNYTLAHPERIEALVLVSASGWPGASSDRGLLFSLLRHPVPRALLIDLDSTGLVRDGLRSAFVDPAFADEPMVERYVELGRAPGHREILIQLSDRDARSDATKDKLAAVRVPTLVLQGAQDRLVPAAHARLFAEAIPGAELVVWEDDGHIPMEEHPDRSATAVATFLGRISF
jgi:pimeloyl-ACP methyl ester carboxylesterase